MKSSMSLPSQYLPEGLWKKVSPLASESRWNAADFPPVSEFESPKLNNAGNSQPLRSPPRSGCKSRVGVKTEMVIPAKMIAVVASNTVFVRRQEEDPDRLLIQMGLNQSIDRRDLSLLFTPFRQTVGYPTEQRNETMLVVRENDLNWIQFGTFYFLRQGENY